MLGELQHSEARRRLGAARGLALSGDARVLPFVTERLEMERDETVRRALAALEAELRMS
jgi:hypothetical protein